MIEEGSGFCLNDASYIHTSYLIHITLFHVHVAKFTHNVYGKAFIFSFWSVDHM